jgi:hypothetical protein
MGGNPRILMLCRGHDPGKASKFGAFPIMAGKLLIPIVFLVTGFFKFFNAGDGFI